MSHAAAGRGAALGRGITRHRARPAAAGPNKRRAPQHRRRLFAAHVIAGAPPPAAPPPASAADNHIAYYQSIVRRNPRDARAFHRLGDAYIRKARESGDVAYFDRAERAIRRSEDT